MLAHQTLSTLRYLKLSGMADAFEQQLEQPATHDLAFEERFALLVDREATHRDSRKLTRLLQMAHLKQPACVEDIDYKHRRGLDKSQMAALVSCDWIRAHQQLHITGPTGSGKSWLACALGHQACRQGLSVRYEQTSRLLEELRIARGDGSLQKQFVALAKTDLLILDDFGLKPLAQLERLDLLDLIEDRYHARSTLVTSQLPVENWHEYVGDPTIADALLDRLLNNAHRLPLKGESMRKKTNNLTHRQSEE
jgi:DNA replication protein DnaC